MAGAFILKNLSIHKMPGFKLGMKPYGKFAPNINIIAGPNASGKSSTSRIIQQIIWRNNTSGIQADSSVLINNTKWDIQIDSNSIRVQQDGNDAELKGLPVEESSGRYELALHKLILENDQDIANEISKIASGGYNLEEAEKQLTYSEGIKRVNINQFHEFEIAKNLRKEEDKKQSELKHEESKLPALKAKKEEAEEAFNLSRLYQKVTELKLAQFKVDQAKSELDSLPAILEKATGSEYKNLELFESEKSDKEKELDNALESFSKASSNLNELDIPKEGISEELLSVLQDRINNLHDIEKRRLDLDSQILQSKANENEAVKAIGEISSIEAWEGIDLKDVSNLEQFLEKAHRTNSEKSFLETAINELNQELNTEVFDSEKLKSGISLLNAWLQEKSSENSKSIIILLISICLITPVLVLIFNLPGLLFLLTMFAIPILKKKNATGGNRELRKKDYLKTNLPSPEIWDEQGIITLMETLSDMLKDAKWQEKISHKHKLYSNSLAELKPKLDELEKTRHDLLDRLKKIPELPVEDLRNYTGLVWFISKVNEWQKCHIYTISLSTEINKLIELHHTELEEINNLLSSVNADSVNNTITARARFNTLSRNELKRKEYLAIINETKRAKGRLENDIKKLTDKVNEIYLALELEIGDKSGLDQRMRMIPGFQKAKENLITSKYSRDEKDLKMKEDSMYKDHAVEIESLTIDEAEYKKSFYELEANNIDSIREGITKIETLTDSYKNASTLETALAKEAAALENLELVYENNLSSITGKLLVDQLRKDSHDHNTSSVYKSANSIFSNITSGKYELRIDTRNEISFKAYDTVNNIGKNLDELSTGTRIQLLLSVRLAYIENQEQGIKLPILADELLANCDDIRAKAIIEALIKISKQGRQIFYFTAQADEVSKWRHFLEKEDAIEYEIHEIALDENEVQTYLARRDHDPISFYQDIPEPGNKTHEAYGKVIDVIPFNILMQEVEQIHLWYLIEDPVLIYKCLRQNVKQWGQLQSFSRNGGNIEGLDGETLETLKKSANLLREFMNFYRKGRSLPVDMTELEKSDAVTGKFKDRIAALLTSLKGDPAALIEALEGKEISGFRESKINELKNYFLSEGFISHEEILEMNEIIKNLKIIISEEKLSETAIEKLINRVMSNGGVTNS